MQVCSGYIIKSALHYELSGAAALIAVQNGCAVPQAGVPANLCDGKEEAEEGHAGVAGCHQGQAGQKTPPSHS